MQDDTVTELVTPVESQDIASEPVETPAPAAAPAPVEPPGFSRDLKALFDEDLARRNAKEQSKVVPRLQQRLEEIELRAKTDPLRFLEEQGISYADLEKMRQKTQDPVADLKEKYESLQSRFEELQQSETNAQRESRMAAVRDNVASWAESNENFPFIRAQQAGHLVFDKMHRHFEATGTEMSEVEAAKAIEADIRDLLKPLVTNQDLMRLLGTNDTEQPAATGQTNLNNQLSGEARRISTDGLSDSDSLAQLERLLHFIED